MGGCDRQGLVATFRHIHGDDAGFHRLGTQGHRARASPQGQGFDAGHIGEGIIINPTGALLDLERIGAAAARERVLSAQLVPEIKTIIR